MDSQTFHSAWREYEAGKDYKRRIGLFETVRKNERFYRGDQWHGSTADLPRPVFNVVRRITDYLVASVAGSDVAIRFCDDSLPFARNENERNAIEIGLEILSKNAALRWKQNRMSDLCRQALLDAAISGDGIFYCWWDPNKKDGQAFNGDIRTDLIDSTNLFVADVNSSDLQSQEYVILSGRAPVSLLRREAREAGVNEKDIAKIAGDDDLDAMAGDLSSVESDDCKKETFLLRFFRENGEVVFEKSTKHCNIKRVYTGLRHYPIAYFHWHEAKNSFHGDAPVSDMIANQKYINTAYAMAMKHMGDTAFSKVIYDKSRIPEWSNEVGEAIGAMGGGNVSDAVSVVGVGKMQEGYLDLIDQVIENTKSMMGATEAALGDAEARNTSAIITLQNASQIGLDHVKSAFWRCIGELATIWSDMLCAYCPPERLLAFSDDSGNMMAQSVNFSLLKREMLRATADSNGSSRYTPASTVSILDKLLELGHLDIRQYIEMLPAGTVENRELLLNKLTLKGGRKDG